MLQNIVLTSPAYPDSGPNTASSRNVTFLCQRSISSVGHKTLPDSLFAGMEDEIKLESTLSALTAERLPPKSTWTTRLHSWLQAPIDNDQHLLEFELTALALSTGIIDAVSFPKFHCCEFEINTFSQTELTISSVVSNQTGNTVLFAITAFSLVGTRQESDFLIPAAHVGTSLGCFCFGVFCAGQLANYLKCKFVRGWLLVSNVAQTCMFLAAAIVNLSDRTGGYLDTKNGNNSPVILVTIALLAFASGMQVAMSRQLGMPEIPTTQATAAYVDLFVDPNFFVPVADEHGRGRNRRVAFLITLVVGSFIGAPAYRYVSTGLTILLASIVKIMVTCVFCFNRAKREMFKPAV